MEVSELDKIGSERATHASLPASSVKDGEKEEAKIFQLTGDGRRKEELKQTVHRAFLWLIRIAAGVIILVVIVRVLHLVLPMKSKGWFGWFGCWLETSQIQEIDKFFFSGALGGLLMKYVGQAVPKDGKE
ncbi:MAG: hypothetical protein QM680_10535 [Luteolibacter sp.]